MGRRQSAQLEVADSEEISARAPEAAPAARTRRKAEAPKSWGRRARKWLYWASLAIAALAVIAAGYRIDQFLASDGHFILTGSPEAHPNLSITGLRYAPQAQVVGVFAEDFGRSIYLMPLAERRRALMRIDWVRDASVSRRWPNRVDVRIYERTPVAFAMLPQSRDASGTVRYEAALVDGEGIILTPPPRARFNLPALYGLTRQQPVEARRERVQQAMDLIAEVQSHSGQISEINADDPENLIVTYNVEGRAVRLMLGNQRYLPRLTRFLANYPEISRRLPGARTFDLRLDDRITVVGTGGSDAR
ncbi:MAG TPA: FtsQ-type POTRA domain-containing protein [Bryobacteraceae bacterium]|nr:FtsQ-type POTRA domain-containing protein [Bryobacteraceae bacterium]HOQ46841.1 FtsQ-type POTRA domain-containing protein [Bryobacteraceae bacterium]HPU73631.1 FtsQ-type POTRA domain-containing protein [Bryobacteraceae bacterium]